jgi:hypothetical protein
MRTLEQAKRDLIALRLHDLDQGERAWVMAAGIPIYVALFGRDSLTAAWQAAPISAERLRGVPAELAPSQHFTQIPILPKKFSIDFLLRILYTYRVLMSGPLFFAL